MFKFLIIRGVIILLLTSCTSKMAYHNLDWLVYWYLDDYIELNSLQKRHFDSKLQNWLDWHKGGELANYQSQLKTIKQQLAEAPLTEKQLLKHFDDVAEHWFRLRQKVVPGLVDMSMNLSDMQVLDMFGQIRKRNIKRDRERSKKSVQQKVVSILKDWIGKLTVQQKSLVDNYTHQLRPVETEWPGYRDTVLLKARKLFETRYQDPMFKQKLRDLLTHPEKLKSETLNKIHLHNNLIYAKMLAAINLTLTDKQIIHLNRALQSLIDDLADLMET